MRKGIGIAVIFLVLLVSIVVMNSGADKKSPGNRKEVGRLKKPVENRERKSVNVKARSGKRLSKAMMALKNVYRNKIEADKKTREETSEFAQIAPLYLDELLSEEEPDVGKEKEILRKGREYLFESRNDGTEIVEIKCTKELCKIEMVHEDELAYQRFHDSAVDNGPWGGTQLGQLDEYDDGRLLTRIYFFKWGTRFPMDGYGKYINDMM